MLRATLAIAVSTVWVLAGACSDITPIDEKTGELSAAERATVREQVSAAVEAKTFKAAWDQEVQAGGDRDRLERIALAALKHHSRHAPDMFSALRTKWGALQPDARAQVSAWSEAAQRNGEWGRALELELVTADDPPAFARAWAVYKAAPPLRATGLLEDIQSAREDHEEEASKKSPGSGG